jgi:hypothetical protein
MKKKLLTLFLLLSMSFSVLHAFVIEALDTHSCEVSEYVYELSEQVYEVTEDDICHLDHLFHISFIIPQLQVAFLCQNPSQKPSSTDKIYEYNSYDNFLKPPIGA